MEAIFKKPGHFDYDLNLSLFEECSVKIRAHENVRENYLIQLNTFKKDIDDEIRQYVTDQLKMRNLITCQIKNLEKIDPMPKILKLSDTEIKGDKIMLKEMNSLLSDPKKVYYLYKHLDNDESNTRFQREITLIFNREHNYIQFEFLELVLTDLIINEKAIKRNKKLKIIYQTIFCEPESISFAGTILKDLVNDFISLEPNKTQNDTEDKAQASAEIDKNNSGKDQRTLVDLTRTAKISHVEDDSEHASVVFNMKIFLDNIKQNLFHNQPEKVNLHYYEKKYVEKYYNLQEDAVQDFESSSKKSNLINKSYLGDRLPSSKEWHFSKEQLELMILKWGMKTAEMQAFYLPERVAIFFAVIWKIYNNKSSKKTGINLLLNLFIKEYLSRMLSTILINENKKIIDIGKKKSLIYFFEALEKTQEISEKELSKKPEEFPAFVNTIRKFYETSFEMMLVTANKHIESVKKDETIIRPQRFTQKISVPTLKDCLDFMLLHTYKKGYIYPKKEPNDNKQTTKRKTCQINQLKPNIESKPMKSHSMEGADIYDSLLLKTQNNDAHESEVECEFCSMNLFPKLKRSMLEITRNSLIEWGIKYKKNYCKYGEGIFLYSHILVNESEIKKFIADPLDYYIESFSSNLNFVLSNTKEVLQKKFGAEFSDYTINLFHTSVQNLHNRKNLEDGNSKLSNFEVAILHILRDMSYSQLRDSASIGRPIITLAGLIDAHLKTKTLNNDCYCKTDKLDQYSMEYQREMSNHFLKQELIKRNCSDIKIKMIDESLFTNYEETFSKNMFLFRTNLYHIINSTDYKEIKQPFNENMLSIEKDLNLQDVSSEVPKTKIEENIFRFDTTIVESYFNNESINEAEITNKNTEGNEDELLEGNFFNQVTAELGTFTEKEEISNSMKFGNIKENDTQNMKDINDNFKSLNKLATQVDTDSEGESNKNEDESNKDDIFRSAFSFKNTYQNDPNSESKIEEDLESIEEKESSKKTSPVKVDQEEITLENNEKVPDDGEISHQKRESFVTCSSKGEFFSTRKNTNSQENDVRYTSVSHIKFQDFSEGKIIEEQTNESKNETKSDFVESGKNTQSRNDDPQSDIILINSITNIDASLGDIGNMTNHELGEPSFTMNTDNVLKTTGSFNTDVSTFNVSDDKEKKFDLRETLVPNTTHQGDTLLSMVKSYGTLNSDMQENRKIRTDTINSPKLYAQLSTIGFSPPVKLNKAFTSFVDSPAKPVESINYKKTPKDEIKEMLNNFKDRADLNYQQSNNLTLLWTQRMNTLHTDMRALRKGLVGDANYLFINQYMFMIIKRFTIDHVFDICLTNTKDRDDMSNQIQKDNLRDKSAIVQSQKILMSSNLVKVYDRDELNNECFHKIVKIAEQSTLNYNLMSTSQANSQFLRYSGSLDPEKLTSQKYAKLGSSSRNLSKDDFAFNGSDANSSSRKNANHNQINYPTSHAKNFNQIINFFTRNDSFNVFIKTGKDDHKIKDAIKKLIRILKEEQINYLNTKQFNLELESEYQPKEFDSSLQHMLLGHFSSILYTECIQNKANLRDLSFHQNCKALKFISLKNLVRYNPKLVELEPHLGPVIECLKMLNYGGGVYEIQDIIEQSTKLINNLIHIVLNTKDPAGADDLDPIWYYAFVIAAPKRMYTICNFIDVFITREDLGGKYGMCFYRINAGIQFVLDANAKILNMEETEFKLRKKENEIKSGIHMYRNRTRHPGSNYMIKNFDCSSLQLF